MAAAAFVYETPNEKAVSGALALLMHAAFVALLIFGVNWQKREQPAMVAELWSNLPPVPAPRAEPPPPPPKAEPAPPKPAPKVEPKPAPKVEPKPTPKAEIDLREKKEKALAEKKKREEQALAEKKRREEQAQADKKRREEQQRAEALRQQQAREADSRREARERDEALKRLAQQQAAAQSKVIDDYTARIRAKIQARINRAGCSSLTNPEIHLKVILLPDGNVLGDPEIRKPSGASSCDTAAIRGVLLAQPLPLPPDASLFPKFRELDLRLRPNE